MAVGERNNKWPRNSGKSTEIYPKIIGKADLYYKVPVAIRGFILYAYLRREVRGG